MVNYLYDLDHIEENHEAYANRGEIAASSAVRKLAPGPGTSGARKKKGA
jgi:malonyl-CoA decarboxylase